MRSEQLDGFKLMPKGLEKELRKFRGNAGPRELEATNTHREKSTLQ